MPYNAALAWIAANTELIDQTRMAIWEYAELGLKEYKSAALLADILERAGFTVQLGAAGMPTAIVASYKSRQEEKEKGKGLVIGFLAEYDALPEVSQAATYKRQPLIPNGNGHGCGHNLLGAGVLGAALAVKAALDTGKIAGEVRFYGCPAEELLLGKVLMVKAGLFSDCDIAITWHPSSKNKVCGLRHLAMNSVKFNFYGISTHASGSPDKGRSALDAVELMNVGTNFLREHVNSRVRIHYVVTNGGIQPNVVPSYSQVWYYVRAPRRREVEEVYKRVLDIAQGAALMAGVTHDVEFVSGCSDTVPNEPLLAAVQANLVKSGGNRFTKAEKEFARKLIATLSPSPENGRQAAAGGAGGKNSAEGADEVMQEEILPDDGNRGIAYGSTDVGDVSWVIPTVIFETACWPKGNPGHSWQTTAAAGSALGLRGTVLAARVMALTAIDCFTDEDLVRRAKEDFERQTAGTPYKSPLPDDMQLKI